MFPRTRNKFVEIVAVAECYLIRKHVKNKESKKQRICVSVKLADGKMSMKKENNSSYIIYIFNLGKMAGKPFT